MTKRCQKAEHPRTLCCALTLVGGPSTVCVLPRKANTVQSAIVPTRAVFLSSSRGTSDGGEKSLPAAAEGPRSKGKTMASLPGAGVKGN